MSVDEVLSTHRELVDLHKKQVRLVDDSIVSKELAGINLPQIKANLDKEKKLLEALKRRADDIDEAE